MSEHIGSGGDISIRGLRSSLELALTYHNEAGRGIGEACSMSKSSVQHLSRAISLRRTRFLSVGRQTDSLNSALQGARLARDAAEQCALIEQPLIDAEAVFVHVLGGSNNEIVTQKILPYVIGQSAVYLSMGKVIDEAADYLYSASGEEATEALAQTATNIANSAATMTETMANYMGVEVEVRNYMSQI